MFGAEGGEGLGERIIESRVVRRVNAVLGLGDAQLVINVFALLGHPI